MLHHLGSNYRDSEVKLSGTGRHLYDAYKLLTNAEVRASREQQPGLAAEMASDIEAISLKLGLGPHAPALCR
jgi:hypothetical protein